MDNQNKHAVIRNGVVENIIIGFMEVEGCEVINVDSLPDIKPTDIYTDGIFKDGVSLAPVMTLPPVIEVTEMEQLQGDLVKLKEQLDTQEDALNFLIMGGNV